MYSFLTTKKNYIAAYVGQRFQFKGKCNKKYCTTLPTYTFLLSTNTTCKIQKSLKVSANKKAIEIPTIVPTTYKNSCAADMLYSDLDILTSSNHAIQLTFQGK